MWHRQYAVVMEDTQMKIFFHFAVSRQLFCYYILAGQIKISYLFLHRIVIALREFFGAYLSWDLSKINEKKSSWKSILKSYFQIDLQHTSYFFS